MNYSLSATNRTNIGRRAHNELKRSLIPAVIYGFGRESESISVPRAEFLKVFTSGGYSSLLDIKVGDSHPVKVVVKEVQVNPITMEPRHIDFHQVRMDTEMTASVPLKFIGESKAVKQDGGTLIKSIDTILVNCLPANLPHEIEVDLSVLNTFEDSICVSSLRLPSGVIATMNANLTVATVARPLTEDELKKMEETVPSDVSAIKIESEEKKVAEEAKKALEQAAETEAKK